jgi:hypothetical protein
VRKKRKLGWIHTGNWNEAIGVGNKLRESVAHVELCVLNAEVDSCARLVARLHYSHHAHLIEAHGVDTAREIGGVVGAVNACANLWERVGKNGAS